MSILLHGHHENNTRCPLSFDMDTGARILEIETIKPEKERPLRLLLLREVDPEELPTKWWEAYAKWQEAYAKWQEANAKWQEANAKLQEANAKLREANATWQKASDKTDWDTWHKEHCGGVKAGVCKWTVAHLSTF